MNVTMPMMKDVVPMLEHFFWMDVGAGKLELDMAFSFEDENYI
jgi:hypothetical protein